MQLNQRLNIKHSQSIVMTPQLRQAIKLLQFSNLELSSYIEEEIEKNPFLENKKMMFFQEVIILNYKKKIIIKALLMIMIKIIRDGKKGFIINNRSNSFDDISSLEDRIAEPKKT